MDLNVGLSREELVLPQVISGTQKHVNHDMVQVSSGPRDPLEDNQETQVPKDASQEDHLGDKLIPERGVKVG